MASSVPAAPPSKPQHLLTLSRPLQDKNFYLLSLMEGNPKALEALRDNAILGAVQQERRYALQQAAKHCHEDTACSLKPLLWTSEEIQAVSAALLQIASAKIHPLHSLLQELRSTGTYALYADQSDAALLVHAWETCAQGMNAIVSVYGQGSAGRYPLIDAGPLDPHASEFRNSMGPPLQRASDTPAPLFFSTELGVALELLRANHRDEAARFEPMEQSANRLAVDQISKTAWAQYPYSAIVVPGEGGGTPSAPVPEVEQTRIRLAAAAYRAKQAPFLLVSGGYVHPSQTTLAEAMDMKKALMQDYGVPESAILMDPHARHTTTNLRNAAREIYRYGLPFQKRVLVVSDPAQTAYIAADGFRDRCLRELGYVPFQGMQRVSDTSLSFLPAYAALEQDPVDPLDP